LSALNSIFKVRLTDILSGYRAFNRKLVKSLPLFGGGFEIETELTIKALERGYRIVEVPIDLSERPTGSSSKIRLVRDGMRIMHTITRRFQELNYHLQALIGEQIYGGKANNSSMKNEN